VLSSSNYNPHNYISDEEEPETYTFNQSFGSYIVVVRIFDFMDGPLSKWELCLRSEDFHEDPYARFNYSFHPRDIENCVKTLRTIKRVQETIPKFFFTNNFNGCMPSVNTIDDKAMESLC